MAITATTLSGAVGASDTQIGVASATGITAPVNTTGAGVTILFVESEAMTVTAVSGTYITVQRGAYGTQAVAHNASSPVLIGAPSDFPGGAAGMTGIGVVPPFVPVGVSAPVASAASITATGKVFHVTGTTQSTSLVPYAGFVEGSITIIPDGIWTWTTGGTSYGFAVAGTVTAAKISVTFTYDAATGLWYPSRVA